MPYIATCGNHPLFITQRTVACAPCLRSRARPVISARMIRGKFPLTRQLTNACVFGLPTQSIGLERNCTFFSSAHCKVFYLYATTSPYLLRWWGVALPHRSISAFLVSLPTESSFHSQSNALYFNAHYRRVSIVVKHITARNSLTPHCQVHKVYTLYLQLYYNIFICSCQVFLGYF